MPMDLNGTSSIVTGGASGLGESTARLLAARGAKVVVLDMNEEKGNKVASDIGGAFVKADVTNTEEVTQACETALEMGPLRSLVTAAGIGMATRTIGKDGSYDSAHNLDLFRRVLEINLVGTFNCVRLAASAMSRTEPVDEDGSRGAIVTVSSVAGLEGQIGQVSYSASKGGVIGMVHPMARDLAVVGIRVNCIAPGLIDTPIYGQGEGSEAFKENLRRDVLFPKRLGTADEFATMALELITNTYMNMQTIRVDGGIRFQPK
ncbi:MAG TPA: SDR family NAD(P)-dependent oxidoreductase [Acidimicrobiales bacterium]|jgi:NAD(P)-dependent dehydrogenase (short-subunit alcohol dehydrogenase family)|nr:SDR family NAD(P)-dependent oxidoreductase [Acidimicrobiales bacterium]